MSNNAYDVARPTPSEEPRLDTYSDEGAKRDRCATADSNEGNRIMEMSVTLWNLSSGSIII